MKTDLDRRALTMSKLVVNEPSHTFTWPLIAQRKPLWRRLLNWLLRR